MVTPLEGLAWQLLSRVQQEHWAQAAFMAKIIQIEAESKSEEQEQKEANNG